MILFFDVTFLLIIGGFFAVCVVFWFFANLLGISDAVMDFANEKTFYIMIGLLIFVSFIYLIIALKNKWDIISSLLSSISLALGLTNAWTMIVEFFDTFTGFDDAFLLVIFGWLLFIVAIVICGLLMLLFLIIGLIPLALQIYVRSDMICYDYFDAEEILKVGGSSVISSIVSLFILFNATDCLTNSLSFVFG